MRIFHCLLSIALISSAALGQPDASNTAPNLASQSAPVAEFKKKNSDDWAKRLPDLLPAIQKCVNDGRVPVLFVVRAWPLAEGMIGVRLLTVQRKQYECVAGKTGMRLDSIKPAKSGDPRVPAAWNPIYYPAREQPPVIACGRVERVMEKKILVGWLQYDPCDSSARAATAK
jgi:hypothetical protein